MDQSKNPEMTVQPPVIKALSMKRLTLLAQDFMVVELKKTPEKDHQKIYDEHRHLLKKFIAYVWDHKNDELI